MAMASDPTQSFHSTRNSVVDSAIAGGDVVLGVSSPRARRRGAGRGNGSVSSPRNRSGFSEPLISSSLPAHQDDSRHISVFDCSSPETVSALQKRIDNDRGGGNNNNDAKVLAWNTHTNSDGAKQASPVIDATLWPVLSKSSQTSSMKSSTSDFQETGPVSTAQVTGIAIPSPSRDYSLAKSIKRGGNLVTDGVSKLTSPRVSDGHLGPKSSEKPTSSATDSSSRDNIRHDDGQRRGLGSLSDSGIEHQQQQWQPFRRGNGGQHPRGSGSRHGYGGKRGEHDRGNQDWFNRNAGRGSNIQTQRPFFPGPPFPIPVPGPVILPNMPGRPFGSPFGYPDVPSNVYPPYLDIYGALHHHMRPVMPPMPMQYPFHDPQLNTRIVSQIDFYFSDENLVKDHYLRQNMDAQGWVSIKLIANFKKVLQLTENIQLILEALIGSLLVEVEGEKVRRRNDWMKWLLPQSFSYSSLSGSKSSKDLLSSKFQSIAVDDLKHGISGTLHSSSSS